jgi:hypothetical protein
MLATELTAGLDYAHRPKPQDPGCRLQKVRFIGPARAGKAKVSHRDGELDGLEEWVPTRTLLCRWAERSPFLRDESRWTALQQAAARDHDPVVEEAISTVFEATGCSNRVSSPPPRLLNTAVDSGVFHSCWWRPPEPAGEQDHGALRGYRVGRRLTERPPVREFR